MTATVFFLAVFTGLLSSFIKEPQPRPNIVYILADDMGYGDVSSLNENGKISTPNIDNLAAEGMVFTDAHTGSSVCTPTRYGIITGRYAWRTRLKSGVLHGYSEHLIDMQRETVATMLKEQGYATAVIGKWHLGMDWTSKDVNTINASSGENVDFSVPVKNGALDLGFDYFFGITASLNMTPHAFMENRVIPGDLEYLGDAGTLKEHHISGKTGWWNTDYRQEKVLGTLADKASGWIKECVEEDRGKPFFLYLPLSAPHAPIVPSENYIGMSGIGSYGDYCIEVDAAVGEVLAALDKTEVAGNTLVIFTADNGCSPQAGFQKLQDQGHFPSYIYRGLKGSLYEGGHRVPFIVRWPGKIAAKTKSDLVICTTDLMATVADIFNVKLDDHTGEDSFSFLGAFSGETPEWSSYRGIVHHSDAGYFAVRKGQWKLIFDEEGGSRRTNPKDPPVKNPAAIQLFDMINDPTEAVNVKQQHPEVVAELTALMKQYIEQGRSTKGVQVSNDDSKKWDQLNSIYK